MRIAACVSAWLLASTSLLCYAQDAAPATYASAASEIVATYQPQGSDHSPHAMAAAAQSFLASLDDGLRADAHLPLDSPERRAWTNVPPSPDDGGVQIGRLNADQVKSLCELLATLFSEQGYQKLCHVMLADDELIRGGRDRFGVESFSVVLFGEPTADGPWAFQLDGHHLGVNLAIEGKKISMSPSFIGTQPEAFHLASENIRPLAGEIDTAFKLINSLSAEQQRAAVLGRRRTNIRTGPGTDFRVPQKQGTDCGGFDAAQRGLLLTLIGQWVNDLPAEQAKKRMAEIAAEIDQMEFGWHGPLKAVSDVSYSIQSPSLVIEYSCQDLGGDPLNHLHTMYRDPTDEYGGQLRP